MVQEKFFGDGGGLSEATEAGPYNGGFQTILKEEDLVSERRLQLLYPLGGERAPAWLIVFFFPNSFSVLPCVSSGSVTEEPHRYTKLGWVQGKQATVLGRLEPVNVFLGIPFAAPPLGPLRFSKPQPPIPWDNLREATAYPNL